MRSADDAHPSPHLKTLIACLIDRNKNGFFGTKKRSNEKLEYK